MNGLAIAPGERYWNEQARNMLTGVALHLLPGLLVTLGFVLIARVMEGRGWPPALALLVTWLVAGVPAELGFLIYEGYKRNRRLSLDGIVLLRERLPLRQYLWIVPLLLLWAATISTLAIPLNDWLSRQFFAWWPGWLQLAGLAQNLSHYSPATVWAVVLLSFPLNLAVPIVEELYFRGYLLPRLGALSRWAPAANVLLFSLYHFWLPWENPMRIVLLLPIVYAVWWKRNIYLSIAVHCLLNTIGSVGLLVLVLTQH